MASQLHQLYERGLAARLSGYDNALIGAMAGRVLTCRAGQGPRSLVVARRPRTHRKSRKFKINTLCFLEATTKAFLDSDQVRVSALGVSMT